MSCGEHSLRAMHSPGGHPRRRAGGHDTLERRRKVAAAGAPDSRGALHWHWGHDCGHDSRHAMRGSLAVVFSLPHLPAIFIGLCGGLASVITKEAPELELSFSPLPNSAAFVQLFNPAMNLI